MDSDRRPVRQAAPQNVRVAGALVALQGAVGAAFGAVFGARALAASGPAVGYGLAEAAFFLLIGAAVAAVGAALVRGHRGVRTPAIVVQLLLLPVVYSLIGPSRQLVWGIVTGLVVILTFLLLISDQSRRWSMGDDYPDE
ncbi:hypothetical protein [Pseudonocardia endophytica]|uniref:Integral membrane protein n=1 Tax=Pseudonocardia endophytica TaxID=401976 RepID=A0A4R1HT56_PSEEN|nr:hypothetical protein [Pseudonocardia endophytica]TCK20592.1 hypothetical protein EV378_4553 [Pseudonocardia endophytica]